MSKLLPTIAALLVSVIALMAGPEPIPSGKEMKQVVPLPVECPNWSGFYLGGFGGYTHGSTEIDPNLYDLWNAYPDKGPLEAAAAHDLDLHGALAGGLIGYNWQLHHLVLGLEASGAYSWLRNSSNTGTFLVPATGNTYSIPTSLKTHYLATFGPRIGYSFCRWMPFVTGGLAVGDIDFEQTIIEHNIVFNDRARSSDTNVGWTVGGGLEYAITNHWRLRGQYGFVDLGSVGTNAIGTAPYQGYNTRPAADLREHNVTAALIYGF